MSYIFLNKKTTINYQILTFWVNLIMTKLFKQNILYLYITLIYMGRKSEQQINSFEETIKDWKCRHCYLNRNSITQNKYNTNSFRNGEFRCVNIVI